MYTEEKIKGMEHQELCELLQSVNYDRLGSANGVFYVMLDPFNGADAFNKMFCEVSRGVVKEYLCRILVEDYESNPEYD